MDLVHLSFMLPEWINTKADELCQVVCENERTVRHGGPQVRVNSWKNETTTCSFHLLILLFRVGFSNKNKSRIKNNIKKGILGDKMQLFSQRKSSRLFLNIWSVQRPKTVFSSHSSDFCCCSGFTFLLENGNLKGNLFISYVSLAVR